MDGYLSQGSSIYHRLVALYSRLPDGKLLRCTNAKLEQHWDDMLADKQELFPITPHTKFPAKVELPSHLVNKGDSSTDVEGTIAVNLLERIAGGENCILGLVVKVQDGEPQESLDKFFMDLVLRCTRQTVLPLKHEDKIAELAAAEETIVDLFDENLRRVTPDDQWTETGRALFLERVRGFTRRGDRIEFVLPAFPCKSSNSDKVGGDLPDRGEMIALTTLHNLVRDIEGVYPPGAQVLIVSDGHVFSDCIGVGDDMVDDYGKKLREMNETIGVGFEDGGKSRVSFQGLIDLLQLNRGDVEGETLADCLELEKLRHPIDELPVNKDAETCRRILMQGFQADTTELRNRIDAKDPAALALYRGFSKFMLEDLQVNVHTEMLSKSKLRKLSSKVAFEMIERNQAYSNMIEMVFPYHVRLSIHAHNNAGPKFGINLMGPKVRATDTLPPTGDAAESYDLLHIPTPWHGCIVEIAGHEELYMTKVEKVEEAMQERKVIGAWVAPALPKKSRSKIPGPEAPAPGTPRLDKMPVVGGAFFSLTPTAAM